MKKVKRLMALLLSVMMLPAVMVWQSKTEASTQVFMEDFESYEVGTIIEAESDQSSPTRVGNIEFQLRSGDKLEIDEENGNKYLKITRASESSTNSNIKYYFPETYVDDKYAISFDFMPDVHNRHFARFGSFIRTGGGINLTTISYGNDVYAHSSTNSNYYIGNLLKTANYDGSYAHITQTIDLTKSSSNYEFTAVYPNGSGGTTVKTRTNTANQLGITGLAWAIQKNTNNNYNGPDDATAAAVYRIDNIEVKTVSLGLVSTNVKNNGTISENTPFTMTFSEAVSSASVTVDKDGVAMDSEDYTVTVLNENVSVIPDEGWVKDVSYTVNVGTVNATSGNPPYQGDIFNIVGSDNLFTENFEGYKVGVIATGPVDTTSTRNPGGLSYKLVKGDTLEIVEKDGSKVLKLTANNTDTTERNVFFDFDQHYGDGKSYDVDYDYYVENNSVWFGDFGSLYDDTVKGNKIHSAYSNCIRKISTYRDSLYFDESTQASNFLVSSVLKSSDAIWRHQNSHLDFSQNINSQNIKITITKSGDGSKLGSASKPAKTTYDSSITVDNISAISWRFKKHGTSAWNGQDSGAGVYYIDNIVLKQSKLELVSTSVENNGKISSSNPFTMTFSDTVSSASIVLKQNGVAMDSDDYEVTTSEKTVSVVPNGGWINGVEYTVNIDSVVSTSGTIAYTGVYTLRGNNTLLTVDFEDYDIGVLATGDVNTISTTRSPGNLVYKLKEGDTLEIVEKDGSKVLKLTVNKENETERRLFLDFNQHYGDSKSYDVDFDYFVENNSVWFKDFGTLYDDKIKGNSAYVHTSYYNAIKPISSYRDNLYFNRKTTEDAFYGENLLDSSDDFWKHQNLRIDFSKSPMPYNVTTTRTSDGKRLARESTTVSQTYGKQVLDNISSICWAFYKNPDNPKWSGQDSGDGVYYIDNITVSATRLSLVDTSITSGDTISIGTDISLDFNASVSDNVADYITILKGNEPVPAEEYSVLLSNENTTVTIHSNVCWDYDSEYKLKITNIQSPSFDSFVGTQILFNTEEYEGTVPPNIVSSTIANDTENVDIATESVVLSTKGVILNETYITKSNIKMYRNDVLISSYSVSPYGKYAVKVNFDELHKNCKYKITVDGLRSAGTSPLAMTKSFVLDFETAGDIYADGLALNRVGMDNTTFNFVATLHNNTDDAQNYQPIVALKNKSNGNILGVISNESGVVAAQDSTNISFSGLNGNPENVYFELFLWKDFAGIEPITGKKIAKKVKIGKTVVFANGTYVVLNNGKPVEEEVSVQKSGEEFIIPASLAAKYIVNTNSDLSKEDIEAKGIGVYVSETYDFIAVGDNIAFDAQDEKDIIKKFGIYVSPDGDDANAGYSSSPVKTLARAVKIYETENSEPIRVHAGKYRLKEAVVLGSKDEGLEIKGFGDGEAIISGAVELPKGSFSTVKSTDSEYSKIPTVAQGKVKKISLQGYVEGDMIPYPQYSAQNVSNAYYELFSGDAAQTIARWPNTSYSTLSGVNNENNSFTLSSNSKANLWKSADNCIIAGYLYWNWAFEDIYIDKENSGTKTITLSKTPKYGLKNGQRFYAMNMLEELDRAGEYYIDNNAKILYYYPTSSFSSVNPELSVMDVTPSIDKNCLIYISKGKNIKISGLTFEKTRGSGIITNGGYGISIDGCVLKNIGNTGVSLNSSKDSEVINSEMYSIGGRCIYAEAGSNDSLTYGNIRVADNRLHNFGRIFRTYQGAIHLAGCGNTAEYNTIYDAPHCAIRFKGSKHTISHNEIYDVVKETSDSGAIYAGRSWTCWGNIISSNYFHDINKLDDINDNDHTNQAIYMDDLMSGTIVRNNVIKDCDCGTKFGGGRGNTFKGNIVVNCNVGLTYDNRGESSPGSKLIEAGGDIYEEFAEFIAKEDVINTEADRNDEYGKSAFTNLKKDFTNSASNIGYPKHATIRDNKFYGCSTPLNLSDHVSSYGTETGNTESTSIPGYEMPEYGARN